MDLLIIGPLKGVFFYLLILLIMFVTIISDCNDANESARQLTRANVLFNCPANSLRLGNYSDIQSSGNLIDILDASEGREGVIILNVAPRFGTAKRWSNGVPFGFFHYKETIVVLTVNDFVLALLKKLEITDEVNVTQIPEVIDTLINHKLIEEDNRDYIINTQFRSYEYAPKLAKLVLDGADFPSEVIKISDNPELEKGKVWFIDSFGNCKTTLLREELEISTDGFVKTRWGDIKFYERLKDVDNDNLGIYIGSSGIGEKRFAEITIQGGSASSGIGINIGDNVLV